MQRSAKIPTMGCTKRTAHCRDFLLAAADVCLILPNYNAININNCAVKTRKNITTG